MQFTTFDQLFRFRSYCLCGDLLNLSFRHSSVKDELITVCPRASYSIENNNSTIRFPLNLESRTSPYGKADFDIVAPVVSPTFQINAHFTTKNASEGSAYSFIKKHFTEDIQKRLNISFHMTCSRAGFRTSKTQKRCTYEYSLLTNGITFDLYSSSVIIPLNEEEFILNDRWNKYIIKTRFEEGFTEIYMPTTSEKIRHYSFDSIIKMPVEKFISYPMDEGFLLNKLKLLTLFS
jgi:hypothetical protein